MQWVPLRPLTRVLSLEWSGVYITVTRARPIHGAESCALNGHPATFPAFRETSIGPCAPLIAGRTNRVLAPQVLRRLYTRQLALPHTTHADTWAEYEAWEATPAKVAQTKPSYAAAVKLFEARAPHEHAVAPPAAAAGAAAADAPDATRLAAYLNYIRFEETADEPMRVQCLYERAIALFPVTHELWMRYLRFLVRFGCSETFVLRRRACRIPQVESRPMRVLDVVPLNSPIGSIRVDVSGCASSNASSLQLMVGLAA